MICIWGTGELSLGVSVKGGISVYEIASHSGCTRPTEGLWLQHLLHDPAREQWLEHKWMDGFVCCNF